MNISSLKFSAPDLFGILFLGFMNGMNHKKLCIVKLFSENQKEVVITDKRKF